MSLPAESLQSFSASVSVCTLLLLSGRASAPGYQKRVNLLARAFQKPITCALKRVKFCNMICVVLVLSCLGHLCGQSSPERESESKSKEERESTHNIVKCRENVRIDLQMAA